MRVPQEGFFPETLNSISYSTSLLFVILIDLGPSWSRS